MPSTFSVIDNTGPNTLLTYLRSISKSCESIDLAVAFITEKGLKRLLYALKRTSNKGRVRVLTGLYGGITEPAALRSLLREQNNNPDHFSVRISTDSRFHWKTYFICDKNSCKFVNGSSNFTEDGLTASGEFNAAINLPKRSQQFKNVYKPFEDNWKSKSRRLTPDILSRYIAWRRDAEVVTNNPLVPLTKILGRDEHVLGSPEPQACSYWRTWVDCSMSKDVVSLLEETTDWDRRGYSYFSGTREIYRRGDKVVLFDLTADEVSLVLIKDATALPVSTDYGRYFAAHSPMRGIPLRRLTKKRWSSLRKEGLVKRRSDIETTRKLSEKTFLRFAKNLKA